MRLFTVFRVPVFLSVSLVALSAATLAVAGESTSGKTLGGAWLGEPMDRIVYAWGDGVSSDGRISYPDRGVSITASAPPKSGHRVGSRVASIGVSDPRYVYEGIKVGQRLPLGKCIRVAGADKLNFPGPCQYKFRDYWWSTGWTAWARAKNGILTQFAVDRGAVRTISIWKCRGCVISPRGVQLD
jgi:hypothetical protein